MAVEVITWVFKHSRSRNGQRLLMLAVADACNSPDGTGAWLSNAALCAKTGLSERAVQVAVRECEKLGELKVDRGRGRGGVNVFTVVMAADVSTAKKGAESAGLTEGAQDLRGKRGAESAVLQTGEAAQVSDGKGAESAGQASERKGAESAPGTVKNSSTKSSTSKKKTQRSEPPRLDVDQICSYLADKIEANGSKRPPITNAWRREARLLLDGDWPTPVNADRVIAAIDWASAHPFWHQNILSMAALRKQWDRLRLGKLAELKQPRRSNPVYRNPDPSAYDDWNPQR